MRSRTGIRPQTRAIQRSDPFAGHTPAGPAGDLVFGFQSRDDAEQFQRELRDRLRQFPWNSMPKRRTVFASGVTRRYSFWNEDSAGQRPSISLASGT